MPITIEWENEQRTIARWTLEGAWTWDDFRAAQAEFHTMLREVDHMVCVIADMRRAGPLPASSIIHFRNAERSAMPNRDIIVLVGSGLLVRAVTDTFNRVFRRKDNSLFLHADSIEDAHALIAQVRPGVES